MAMKVKAVEKLLKFRIKKKQTADLQEVSSLLFGHLLGRLTISIC